MTSRMLKQSENVKLLYKCSPSQRKFLIKSSIPALIHAICDCITNIIHQKIPITAKHKKGLATKKKRIENIIKQQNQNPQETAILSVERSCVIISIAPRKMFLVILSDMYNMMTKHSAKSYQSEENVWNKGVPPHEKVKQFTEELSKFR